MKHLILSLLLAVSSMATAADIVWYDGTKPVSYRVEGKAAPVVSIALDMFASDMEAVTGQRAIARKDATIIIYELDTNKAAASKLRQMGIPVDSLLGHLDAFYIAAIPSKKQGNGNYSPPSQGGAGGGSALIIVGSNGRGCAYGILELSRLAGVSPWIWWGDVVPEHKDRLTLPETFSTLQSPSVEYRGIFINDEDWSLRNWAWKHYENNGVFGQMGPKTYKAVFQLLLRLRANAIWPGMHTGTPGFFTIAGNKELADSCGILIGTSHCEPLLRNNVAEWDVKERGPYNYITNRERVQQYWTERLQQVKGSEEFFTIGMRGIHDGSMEGVKTKQEKLDGLQMVIDDQRELIRKYYNKDVERVPQVFIPYKEVLEILESGLRVPDDVTLMWCDDNYGYMTRLSDEEQQRRSGGGGVYYHLSYWGRPHDYLWLTTTQPGLIYSEMKAAYDHNCRKLWIVNVHDPKVAAYPLEFFLDMAWDIEGISPTPDPSRGGEGSIYLQRGEIADNVTTPLPPAGGAGGGASVSQHLLRWLCTQFGHAAGEKLFPAMEEFYRLTAIRKPEFMGWTQVELSDRKAYPRGRSQVVDTEFSETEFDNEVWHYLSDYAHICLEVEEAEKLIRPELKEAYFAAIKYPVLAARAMAAKHLEAQMARSKYQGQTDKDMEGREDYMRLHAARAMYAYRDIQRLTQYYNDSLANGKWKGIMNMMPRDLNVFNPPLLPYLPAEYEHVGYGEYLTHPVFPKECIARNACRYTKAQPEGTSAEQDGARNLKPQIIEMLGHSMRAVAIPKGCTLSYDFTYDQEGAATLYTAMIPTQPNDKGDLRYSVQIDDQEPVVISLKEKYRSDFWKLSVLRGQALKQTPVTLSKGRHTLRITALDDHIIADQWMLDFKPGRKFYVIPAH